MIRRAAKYVAKEVLDHAKYPMQEFISFLQYEYPCPGDREFNMDETSSIFTDIETKFAERKNIPPVKRECDCLAYKILYFWMFAGYDEGILWRHKEFSKLALHGDTRALFTLMKIMYFKKAIVAWGITNTPHIIGMDWRLGGCEIRYIPRGPVNFNHPYADYWQSIMGPDSLHLIRSHTNLICQFFPRPHGIFIGDPEHVPIIKWLVEAINFNVSIEVRPIMKVRPRHIMHCYPSHSSRALYLEERDIKEKKIQPTIWTGSIRIIDGTNHVVWKEQLGSGGNGILILPRNMLYKGELTNYAITLTEAHPPPPLPTEDHQREFGIWFHQQANSG